MKDAFDRQGYVIVKNFFYSSEIAGLTAIIDRIYAQWLRANRIAWIRHGLINMHSLTDSIYFAGYEDERRLFFEMLAPEKLTTLVNGIFGKDMYFHNTQLFFNPFDNGTLPYWHRDMQYSAVDDSILQREQPHMISVHLRIPLLPEKGVELISGTHARWDTDLEHDVRLERNGHKKSDDLPGSILIELSAGDLLIFSAQMIHRGHYSSNKARKALDLCVGKPHPLTSNLFNEGVLPGPLEMDRIANNGWYRLARAIIANNPSPQIDTTPG